MSEYFYLHAAGGAVLPAVTIGQGLPKEVNGVPAFYYWRQSAKDGEYVHPIKKFRLSIDAGRRQTWESNFKKMQANSVAVPVVKDHKMTSDSTLGYVVDVRQNDPWYEELHQYLGADARDTALRNRLSVGIDTNYADGKGLYYGDSIFHSSTTPLPVVPGTGDAIQVALSRGAQQSFDVFELAAETSEGGSDMELTPEQIAAVKEVIGGASQEVTSENAFDLLLGWSKGVKNKYCMSMTKEEVTAKVAELSTAQTALTKAQGDLTAATTRITELSRTPNAPDPETLADRAELTIGRIDLSAARGEMPVAFAQKLAKFVKPEGKPNVFMLSRADAIDSRPIDFIVGLFAGEKLGVAVGTQTGIQTLSRGTGDDQPAVDPKKQQEEIDARAKAVS